jgi:hypothetical protein
VRFKQVEKFRKNGCAGVYTPAHPFLRPSFNSNETHSKELKKEDLLERALEEA